MQKILDKIKEYQRIIIFRHFRPDGDAMGSTMGLAAILRLTYPEKEIYLQNCDSSAYLAFMGGEDEPIADDVIPIAYYLHEFQEGSIHNNPNEGLDLKWKQKAQAYYEEHYG